MKKAVLGLLGDFQKTLMHGWKLGDKIEKMTKNSKIGIITKSNHTVSR